MKATERRIGCVGHDCDECKRNRRILAAARRWHELTHDKVCSFLVHSGPNSSLGVAAHDKLCKACAADAAARKRRRT